VSPSKENQHKIIISLAKYFPRFSTTIVAVVRQQAVFIFGDALFHLFFAASGVASRIDG
jgi:hypothetical protein